MALNANVIPQIWAARFLTLYRKNTVWTQTTTDLSSEIPYGDRITIPELNTDVTIGDYVKYTDIADPEDPSSDKSTLIIDQQKYWHVEVDDLEKVQSNGDLVDKTLFLATRKMAETTDDFYRTTISNATGVAAANKMTSDVSGTLTAITDTKVKAILDTFADMAKRFDDLAIPDEGRWVVMNGDLYSVLVRWFSNRQYAAGSVQGAIEQASLPGALAGFRIIKDTRMPIGQSTGKNVAVFGTNFSTYSATQINSVESYRPEKRFGDAIKGLMTYGLDRKFPEYIGLLNQT